MLWEPGNRYVCLFLVTAALFPRNLYRRSKNPSVSSQCHFLPSYQKASVLRAKYFQPIVTWNPCFIWGEGKHSETLWGFFSVCVWWKQSFSCVPTEHSRITLGSLMLSLNKPCPNHLSTPWLLPSKARLVMRIAWLDLPQDPFAPSCWAGQQWTFLGQQWTSLGEQRAQMKNYIPRPYLDLEGSQR